MPPGRTTAALALALIVIGPAAAARASELPARIDVRAGNVEFFPYANGSLLAADGGVVVQAGTRRIEAAAIRYDLTKNALTAAGDVRVTVGSATLTASAYRVDLATGDAYFVRLEPVPATFAVHAGGPEIEGAAPAGTFDQVDLDGQRPYIRSRHAIVNPSAGIRMVPAEFPTGAGPALTLPTYLYTLVQNQNIAQTAGPGASFDQPYNLFGSTNSLTAAHLRYDAQYGVTVGLDTRLVDRDRAYVVTSVLPLRDRRVDLLAFQQLRAGLQQTFSATHVFGTYPIDTATYRLQHTGKFTTETIAANQFNTSNGAELDLSTLSHDVGHYFTYQLNASYGYDHNLYGYPYANDFRSSLGGYVTPPGITLLGASFNARYDYRFTSYDFPHQTATGTVTLSGGRTFARRVSLYASAAIAQNSSRYRDPLVGARALGLPDANVPYVAPDGTLYPGYFAYAGLSTYRTYQLQTTFLGRTGDDRIQITLTHARDFPQYHGLGRPPLTAYVDVTRRITPTIRLELGRSYTFGWGGRYFSPQYSFAISP